ncbi:hypothetical protein BJY01DRAFT_219471 [Aspergillus pseudoustus]|uniref:Aminoacyl-transfer RNA synthetases class-II family profile domain-containing protein n=1 Tax=Aspergillus pseudoustus TaxID=1810923 RepID=A0ABR4JGF4_9EURO
MLPWRRAFSTSFARLNHGAPVNNGYSPRLITLLTDNPKKPRSFEDQNVTIQGLVRSVRKQKTVAFAAINDGSFTTNVQAVLSPEQASDLSTGAAVEISGIWKACKPGAKQTHELHATTVTVVGGSDPETYPIQKKYLSPEFLRQNPHLRFRTPANALLARFRSAAINRVDGAFGGSPGRFIQVHPPLITSSDCEGAGETFAVIPRETLATGLPEKEQDHFFRAPKYLSVSSQLHLEAYAAQLGNVWALAPVFRAEKSDTPRHLSEFYMLETESNFLSDLRALTNICERILCNIVRRLEDAPVTKELFKSLENKEEDSPGAPNLLDLKKRWAPFAKGQSPWRRITYTKAIAALQEAVTQGRASFEYAPTWSAGLQLEHERYIVDVINDGRPVFVTDYPKAVKPFYMAPSHDRNAETEPGPETVACFDLLFPGIGEVAGGSLREHRLPELIQNMREHGLIKKTAAVTEGNIESEAKEQLYPHLLPGEDLGHLKWYADLRRWGSAPHGGFGIGFDRFLSYLTGVSNIRDIVAFPRYSGKADC